MECIFGNYCWYIVECALDKLKSFTSSKQSKNNEEFKQEVACVIKSIIKWIITDFRDEELVGLVFD